MLRRTRKNRGNLGVLILHHLPTMNIALHHLILLQIQFTNNHAYQWHVTSYLLPILPH
jgi:hypothetical protein